MLSSLESAQNHDRSFWDSYARIHKKSIAHGCPEVTACKNFEEDLIDRILSYLIREKNRQVRICDIACGSGRLHLRYGLKSVHPGAQHPYNEYLVNRARGSHTGYEFDQDIEAGLKLVEGVDISAAMIATAIEKLAQAGLTGFLGNFLSLNQGSAFSLSAFPDQPLPLVVALNNSIGVMQGPQGAAELFKSMRQAVEAGNGIAIISAFCRKAVQSFALENYESAMETYGEPKWLIPELPAGQGLRFTPKVTKHAYESNNQIAVDVYDRLGALIQKNLILKRDPQAVEYAAQTGHMETYTGYQTYWYGWDQMQTWIESLWPSRCTYHLDGRRMDSLRATPVQLAILDAGNHLQTFIQRWLDSPA